MAIAAGFPLLHLQHAVTFVAGARNVYIRVAIVATVSGNMHKMAEYGAPRTEVYLFDCMTFLAVGFDPKSALVIMTSSAGTPLRHFGHRRWFIFFVAGNKNFIMAIGTTEKCCMHRVTESSIAGLLNLIYDINSRFVAFIAGTFNAECGGAVMAESARFTFFHLLHRKSFVADPCDEGEAVTITA